MFYIEPFKESDQTCDMMVLYFFSIIRTDWKKLQQIIKINISDKFNVLYQHDKFNKEKLNFKMTLHHK